MFVNWWYTAENLYEAGGITNDHALRTDVSTDNLRPQYIRQPDINYFFHEADPSVDPNNNPGLDFVRQIANHLR